MATKEVCEKFAEDNLLQCATEILEWKTSGILGDGVLRELAKMCQDWVGDRFDLLTLAETVVQRAALKFAVTTQAKALGYSSCASKLSINDCRKLEGKLPYQITAFWDGWNDKYNEEIRS